MKLRETLRNMHIVYHPYVFLKGVLNAKINQDIHSLLLFIGYPRSGSSTLASILDAHKNILISHELNALDYFRKGYNKNQLFWLIRKNSRLSALRNRISSNYPGIIVNQCNGEAFPCTIIGDKKAGGSTAIIEKYPSLINDIPSKFGVKLKLVHIIRNPFDMITTQAYGGNRLQKNITRADIESAINFCFQKLDTIEKLTKYVPPLDIFHVRHEDLIANPKPTLSGILKWLNAEIDDQYLKDCENHLFKEPHQSRKKFNWPPDLIEMVEEKISQLTILKGYTFE